MFSLSNFIQIYTTICVCMYCQSLRTHFPYQLDILKVIKIFLRKKEVMSKQETAMQTLASQVDLHDSISQGPYIFYLTCYSGY